MIGWLITLSALTVLLTMKVGLWFRWESGEAVLKVRIGLFHFAFPTMEGSGKHSKMDTMRGRQKEQGKSKPSMKKWIRVALRHWQELLELVGRALRTPQLDLLRIQVAAGGNDAEACAMHYGRICAGLGIGLPLVHQTFHVKKQDVDVTCCFQQPETEILAEVEATVRIYQLLVLLTLAVGLLYKLYQEIKYNEKAVQSL